MSKNERNRLVFQTIGTLLIVCMIILWISLGSVNSMSPAEHANAVCAKHMGVQNVTNGLIICKDGFSR